MTSYSVYKITNNINNKCYIGYSKDSNCRWKQHKDHAGKVNKPLYNEMNKYDSENFSFHILYSDIQTKDEACAIEMIEIKDHNSCHPTGYNLTAGGEGGDTFSNSTELSKSRRRDIFRKQAIKNNPMNKGSIFEIWEQKYGKEVAENMRNEYSNKMSKIIIERHKDPEYIKELGIRVKKSKENGIGDDQRRHLTEHNKLRNYLSFIYYLHDKLSWSTDKISEIFNTTPDCIELKVNKKTRNISNKDVDMKTWYQILKTHDNKKFGLSDHVFKSKIKIWNKIQNIIDQCELV